MSRHLVLSFRFLAPWFHGRRDESAPEWPPSPLRVFQALVTAAARAGTLDTIRTALTWLERRPAPCVVAPIAVETTVGYRLSVPHNAMDLVAKQWRKGDEGGASVHRTMKNVRPHLLPNDSVVHYAWQLEADASEVRPLIECARAVVALGWGVDLVVGDGAVLDSHQLAELSRDLKVWEPRSDGAMQLRTPARGTLADLERRHAAVLSRTSMADPTLRVPPSLSAFNVTEYARTDQPPLPAIAGFMLLRTNSDNFRAFESARRGKAVAGMLRHSVRTAAERAGWDDTRVNKTILGHGDSDNPRLLLIPVPSIEPRESGEKVGAIRRVMVFSTEARSRDVSWIDRALGGRELIDEVTGEVQAVLAAAPRSDRVLKRYVTESSCWVTVTPVVLPGHDDPGGLREKLYRARNSEEQNSLLERLAKRQEALIRNALRHAGLGDELAFSARVEAREAGFLAGVEHASRYLVPKHLSPFSRLHVRLTWPTRVRGPLCIGRGRFSGMGLFAPARP